MIKDALAKLDEIVDRPCSYERSGEVWFIELREILVALAIPDQRATPDEFVKSLEKKWKEDIERRVGELEKKQMAVSQSVGGDSFKFLSDKEEDVYTEKDGTPIVHDEGNGVDNDGNIIQYKVHGGKSEVKEEKPSCQFAGIMTTSGNMWCETCDKWHKVIKLEFDPDTIKIPRSVAEEAIRIKANLPNELYDAIKTALK